MLLRWGDGAEISSPIIVAGRQPVSAMRRGLAERY
jgi:hypothetical protein